MKSNTQVITNFRTDLLRWNRLKNDRKMPWKGEKDPYKIWLSEIILQQTRVEQGLDYYQKFISAFPDIHKLAAAREQRVYKLWEGLGYYTRCKNLIETARYISKNRKGSFPESFEEILALKGVGEYTASAIASFAYNLPHAVVDGNVFRLLSRFFGIKTPIDSASGKKIYARLAFELLDKKRPGIYNQALMDFGAIICKPQAPNCKNCVFARTCKAYKKNMVDQLPVKEKKINLKKRWFSYFVLQYRDKIYIQKRMGSDIWNKLHEFVLIESAKKRSTGVLLKEAAKQLGITYDQFNVEVISGPVIQTLSHQKIEIRFFKLKLSHPLLKKGLMEVRPRSLKRYAFPKTLKDYVVKEFGHFG